MGREIKRVPLDFDAPLDKGWSGYDLPDDLRGVECADCAGRGWSPRAHELSDLWYGYAAFRPEDNGSTPLTSDTPAVREFAEWNVTRAPEFYGVGEWVIIREAQRLASLWNESWSHHLSAQDIVDMVKHGALREFTHQFVPGEGWRPIDPPAIPTAEQVNEASIRSFNAVGGSELYAVTIARCAREGVPITCDTCGGEGHTFRDDDHKAAHDAWESTDPPEGEGWQLWQTVSDGPISPVFPAPEGLIEWMTTPAAKWGASGPWSREQAAKFVLGDGWAPTFISTPATGLVDGVTALTSESRAS